MKNVKPLLDVLKQHQDIFLNEKPLSSAKEGDRPWVPGGTGDMQNFRESPLRTDATELFLNPAVE